MIGKTGSTQARGAFVVGDNSLISTVVTVYNIWLRMTFRVLVAFFAGVTSVITTILIPVAYFGDKNSRWAARLAIVAFIAAVILMVAIFWGV